MITAVDTSVLLDVFGADLKYGTASAVALDKCAAEGSLVASAVVWSETAAAFAEEAAFERAMRDLGVSFSPLTEAAANRAARQWRSYRQRGGRRDRITSDFLIGAHALIRAERLLTRDRGFFRQYFSGLRVIDPSLP
jgi:predicted nucleic acid-binding protein